MTSSMTILTKATRMALTVNRSRYLRLSRRGRGHSRTMTMTMSSKENIRIKLRRVVHQPSPHRDRKSIRELSRMTRTMKMMRKTVRKNIPMKM